LGGRPRDCRSVSRSSPVRSKTRLRWRLRPSSIMNSDLYLRQVTRPHWEVAETLRTVQELVYSNRSECRRLKPARTRRISGNVALNSQLRNPCCPSGTRVYFPLHPGLTSRCENLCRPRGTRIYFPLHPALRLRLRAGLSLFRPTGSIFARSVPHANQNLCSHTDSYALGYYCYALRARFSAYSPTPVPLAFIRLEFRNSL
jgi:hypothetical protein